MKRLNEWTSIGLVASALWLLVITVPVYKFIRIHGSYDPYDPCLLDYLNVILGKHPVFIVILISRSSKSYIYKEEDICTFPFTT